MKKKVKHAGPTEKKIRLRVSPPARISTGVRELDEVLGGGLPLGSVTLLRTEVPAMGATTLAVRVARGVSTNGYKVSIASADDRVCGRESYRLADHFAWKNFRENSVRIFGRDVREAREFLAVHGVLIVDSVDRATLLGVDAKVGSKKYVSAVMEYLSYEAHRYSLAVLALTRRVFTSDHDATTVVYLEDCSRPVRILRCGKNRFAEAGAQRLWSPVDE